MSASLNSTYTTQQDNTDPDVPPRPLLHTRGSSRDCEQTFGIAHALRLRCGTTLISSYIGTPINHQNNRIHDGQASVGSPGGRSVCVCVPGGGGGRRAAGGGIVAM